MRQPEPEMVRRALHQVSDSLLGQSIVDLGLVRDVRPAGGGRIVVTLTLPAPDWPSAGQITDAVRSALLALPGVADVRVELIWQPAWTPYRMAEYLKAPLGLPEEEPAALSSVAEKPAGGRLRRLSRRLWRD